VRFFRRRDLHALAGAYALNALDGDERDRFERHLRGCRACESEVRGFAATAAALAVATAAEPPPELKQRVLAAAAVTRQSPPAGAEGAGATAGAEGAGGARTTGHRRPRATAPRRSWLPRLAVPVAAAGLVAAAVLGGVTVWTQHQLTTAQAENQAITAVLAAPDAQIASARTSAGGIATVVASHSAGSMVFTSAGLHALPPSSVYELWFLGKTARPAGLLPPARAGRTAPVLASGLKAGDKVGVTVEPAGGSSSPTTTPIVVLTLSA
jgi:anti-sigma-K factor RskA